MITFQVDSLENSWSELSEIWPTHHAELALFKDKMPLDMDVQEYVRRERAGILFIITGRIDGKIGAYYVAQVNKGFHYQSTLTGTADIYYIIPEYRNRGLALPLFRMVEKELKRRGVRVWYSGHKFHNPMGAGRLHELMGFIPADHYWVRWIGQ